MNYQETLEYLYSRFPTFHLTGGSAYKAGLENTLEIGRLTGNPHLSFKTIHIAGTNGKGSVSHMLASILQESGFRTALFTSPHLKDFRERVKVNGAMVSEAFVCQFVEQYKKDFERIEPSFFEMSFGLAMSWFKLQGAEIAVIETGMGGRLDSTNVVKPLLSVITNIGLDHTKFLGSGIAEIASEKAGIIKQNTPVIIGETHPESAPVFRATAAALNAELTFADETVLSSAIRADSAAEMLSLTARMGAQEFRIHCPLTGSYQLKNVATVLCACLKLQEVIPPFGRLEIEKGIRNTLKNTRLQGRWQILSHKPLVICDIAHNPHGLEPVVNQILAQEYTKLHIVIGVVNDKDIDGMLKLLPQNATYYFCKAAIPRGLDALLLQKEGVKYGLKGDCYSSVSSALEAAKKYATADDLIFIGGSAFTVAEIL